MRVIINHFLGILVAFCSSLMIVSCGKDDPELVPKNSFTIKSNEYSVKSAGYYHNDSWFGYNIVLSSESLDLSNVLEAVPNGFLFVMDIPDLFMDGEYNIKEIDDTIVPDGNGWRFYISYAEEGVVPEQLRYEKSDFKSGSFSWSISGNSIEGKFYGTLNDGTELSCEYSGPIQQSSNYICAWL